MHQSIYGIAVTMGLLLAPAAGAEEVPVPRTVVPAGTSQLDGRIEGLKKDVMELNRDLLVLEEELLFPATTQFAVFVSMDVGEFFRLDGVELLIDNEKVASHLYTDRELQALQRGGVQRLYVGNLRNGKHELTALFTGQGPHERAYRRGANIAFEKNPGAKYLEVRVQDKEQKLQPEFSVKEW